MWSNIGNKIKVLAKVICWIGITISWVGAIRGGSTSPESSPCTIMIAPIRRVVIPQEV